MKWWAKGTYFSSTLGFWSSTSAEPGCPHAKPAPVRFAILGRGEMPHLVRRAEQAGRGLSCGAWGGGACGSCGGGAGVVVGRPVTVDAGLVGSAVGGARHGHRLQAGFDVHWRFEAPHGMRQRSKLDQRLCNNHTRDVGEHTHTCLERHDAA